MDIKDSKIVTELKVVRDRLKDIDITNIGYENSLQIVRCENSLDLLINLIDYKVL